MNALEKLLEQAPVVEEKLGYTFKDKTLLAMAFVHRSFVNENRAITLAHNERLEFLGDSVLGLLIADYVYRFLPGTPEGELSYLRSRLVEASSCMLYVQKIQVEEFLLLGKGERLNDGRGRDSILSDLFEALVGAIYLDGGLEAARDFLFRNFSTEFDAILRQPEHNWKALLQDYSQKKYQHPPKYTLIEQTGPDHSKRFQVAVIMNDIEFGRGEGASKKEAQQAAAADAMARIRAEKVDG